MTTEIEKELFEKYGVESRTIFSRCKNGIDYYEDCTNNCKNCLHAIYETTYPPITAEKVLRLIELLITKRLDIGFSYSQLHKTYYSSKDSCTKGYLSCVEKDFRSSFYSLLVQLHKHLTPQERNEVKQILKN